MLISYVTLWGSRCASPLHVVREGGNVALSALCAPIWDYDHPTYRKSLFLDLPDVQFALLRLIVGLVVLLMKHVTFRTAYLRRVPSLNTISTFHLMFTFYWV